MTNAHPRFLSLAAKTIAVHTVSYLCMGILASSLLAIAPPLLGFLACSRGA